MHISIKLISFWLGQFEKTIEIGLEIVYYIDIYKIKHQQIISSNVWQGNKISQWVNTIVYCMYLCIVGPTNNPKYKKQIILNKINASKITHFDLKFIP